MTENSHCDVPVWPILTQLIEPLHPTVYHSWYHAPKDLANLWACSVSSEILFKIFVQTGIQLSAKAVFNFHNVRGHSQTSHATYRLGLHAIWMEKMKFTLLSRPLQSVRKFWMASCFKYYLRIPLGWKECMKWLIQSNKIKLPRATCHTPPVKSSHGQKMFLRYASKSVSLGSCKVWGLKKFHLKTYFIFVPHITDNDFCNTWINVRFCRKM